MNVQEYLVTLGVRPAELSALKELPGPSKDKLTPLLLLAPWLATSPLSRALDKFEEAYPSRPYFIDIDTYYQINDNRNEAKELWSKLASKPADITVWWELLSEYPNANPCLLMANQSMENAYEQIYWARENNRTFCLRINLADGIGSGMPSWMPSFIEQLAKEGVNDYAILLEFGWTRDPLLLEAKVVTYTSELLSEISQQVPVIVSCTSFPKDFSTFDAMAECPFTNSELMAKLKQRTNHPRIIYGDWGSTRPRTYGHASAPRNRIDYPSDNLWVIARNQTKPLLTFEEAAKRVMNSDHWSGNLGI